MENPPSFLVNTIKNQDYWIFHGYGLFTPVYRGMIIRGKKEGIIKGWTSMPTSLEDLNGCESLQPATYNACESLSKKGGE